MILIHQYQTGNGIESEHISVSDEVLNARPLKLYRGIGEFPYLQVLEEATANDLGVESPREVGLDEWNKLMDDQEYDWHHHPDKPYNVPLSMLPEAVQEKARSLGMTEFIRTDEFHLLSS